MTSRPTNPPSTVRPTQGASRSKRVGNGGAGGLNVRTSECQPANSIHIICRATCMALYMHYVHSTSPKHWHFRFIHVPPVSPVRSPVFANTRVHTCAHKRSVPSTSRLVETTDTLTSRLIFNAIQSTTQATLVGLFLVPNRSDEVPFERREEAGDGGV